MKITKIASIFFFLLLIPACQNDVLRDSTIVIPQDSEIELDKWIDTNFRIPDNIHVTYKWNSGALNPSHELVPPKEELVQPFLKTVLKIWRNPYISVADDKVDFMKKYACRELVLVGSGSWNIGSVTLGEAANGYKITLYTVNQFDATETQLFPVREFFRVMHHEFGHILNQRKPYDPNFKQITGNYTADWTRFSDTQARESGFISAYSRSGDGEDFVEILSYYISYTESEWQGLLKSITSAEAQNYIILKLQSVKSYMKDVYGINLDDLRSEVTKAMSEVLSGNYEINQE